MELFGDPLLALARGDFNRRVALLVGFNTNEVSAKEFGMGGRGMVGGDMRSSMC